MINTALSAFFVFSGKVIYPSYQLIRLSGTNPVDDQALAGALMWVPGSLIYLLPAFVLASRLLAVRPPGPEVLELQKDRAPLRTSSFFPRQTTPVTSPHCTRPNAGTRGCRHG